MFGFASGFSLIRPMWNPHILKCRGNVFTAPVGVAETNCSLASHPHLMSSGCEGAPPAQEALRDLLLLRQHWSSEMKHLWVNRRPAAGVPSHSMAVSVTYWYSHSSRVEVGLLPTHQPFFWAPVALISTCSLRAWDELSLMVDREVSDQTFPLLLAGTLGDKNSNDQEQQICWRVLGLGESFWEQGAIIKGPGKHFWAQGVQPCT